MKLNISRTKIREIGNIISNRYDPDIHGEVVNRHAISYELSKIGINMNFVGA